MKIYSNRKKNKEKGFIMLFAIVITSIILAITLSVQNISLKEVKFSTSAKNTNEAFFAADTGVECAFLNNRSASDSFIEGGSNTISCLGNDAIPLLGVYPNFSFVLYGLGSTGEGCAKVGVNVDDSVSPLKVAITSKGYSKGDFSCFSSDTNRVERELEVIVGGHFSVIPPPVNYNLTVSNTGTGSGNITSGPSGISCGSTCGASFSSGTIVTLSAVADSGSVFTGWSGACSGGNLDCDVTVDADKSAVAIYDTTSQISFVGANVSGSSSVNIPSHNAGDLIILFAYRDGSTSAPSRPNGWTTINSGGGSSNSSRLAYVVDTVGNINSVTSNNATLVIAQVYRGENPSNPIGADDSNGGSGTTVTYPGINLNNTNGTSWVATFAGHRSTNTSLENSPALMINPARVNLPSNGAEVSGFDTNEGVPSWNDTNVSVGGSSSGWRTSTVEIISN